MKVLRDKDKVFGNGYTRVSRWLKVEYTIVSEKHQLANYTEKSGSAGLWLNYFKYQGKQYALGQFMRLATPIILEDGSIISGFDSTNYYEPLMIEISSDGESVRLWKETPLNEEG